MVDGYEYGNLRVNNQPTSRISKLLLHHTLITKYFKLDLNYRTVGKAQAPQFLHFFPYDVISHGPYLE